MIKFRKCSRLSDFYRKISDVKGEESKIEFYGIIFKKFFFENVSLQLVELNFNIDYTSNSMLE